MLGEASLDIFNPVVIINEKSNKFGLHIDDDMEENGERIDNSFLKRRE